MNHTIPVNPLQVNMAAMMLKSLHPIPALHRALDRAMPVLLSETPWSFEDGTLAMVSKSHTNTIRYADADSCDCPAMAGCYHRAAALICQVLTAAGIHPIARLPLVAVPDVDDCDEAEDVARWAIDEESDTNPFIILPLAVAHKDRLPGRNRIAA